MPRERDNDNAPDFEGAYDHVLTQLIRFTRGLQRDGVDIPANASVDGARALAQVRFDDQDRVRAALQATLVSDKHDIDAFNDRFPRFWFRLREGLEDAARGQLDDSKWASGETGGVSIKQPSTMMTKADTESFGSLDTRSKDSTPHVPEIDAKTEAASYSSEGVTSEINAETETMTVSDRDLKRFERAISHITGRRWQPRDSGPYFDVRQALRTSLQTGGTVINPPRRIRKPTKLQACVLVDVSKSVIDMLNRDFLLEFLTTFQRRNRSVRTFFFDTDIREVTNRFEPSAGAPSEALRQAEIEWGGGTRIGDALHTLRQESPTAVDRRTTVIMISDGLDIGEMELLERGMVWLYRRSQVILWLNPLAASSEYEPTARGMATALPYVDGLFGFTDSTDLSKIARQIRQRGLC